MQSTTTAAATESRGSHRSNVFLAAVLHAGGSSSPVRIRNLSASGALVDGKDIPDQGAQVRLQRGPHSAVADVVWRKPGLCGVRFSSAVPVNEWISYAAGHKGQQRVDEIVASVRAGLPKFEAPVPAPTHASRAVDRLNAVSEQLDTIAADLAAVPVIVEQAAPALQLLDIARQKLADFAAGFGDGGGG